MRIRNVTDPAEKRRVAKQVLADLPEWFGIPESTAAYIDQSADQTMFEALTDGETLGFMCLKETSPCTIELAVCGVKKRFHRQGIGRALLNACLAWAKARNYTYMQVKTVAAGRYAEYDATRCFYEASGFQPVEVFPTLWDENNPCLLMIRPISSNQVLA